MTSKRSIADPDGQGRFQTDAKALRNVKLRPKNVHFPVLELKMTRRTLTCLQQPQRMIALS